MLLYSPPPQLLSSRKRQLPGWHPLKTGRMQRGTINLFYLATRGRNTCLVTFLSNSPQHSERPYKEHFMVSWKEERFAGPFAAETSRRAPLNLVYVCVSHRLYDGFKCQSMAVEIQWTVISQHADQKKHPAYKVLTIRTSIDCKSFMQVHLKVHFQTYLFLKSTYSQNWPHLFS